MRKIKNLMTYLWAELKLTFSAESTYGKATFLRTGTNILIMVISIYLWRAIYAGGGGPQGYTLDEMILYIAFVRVLKKCCYPLWTGSTYGQRVRNGDIGGYLLKPIRMEWQLLGASLGGGSYSLLTGGVPALVVAAFFIKNWPSLSLSTVGLLLFYIVSAYGFVFVFELWIGLISYYTYNLWGVNRFKMTLISFVSGELLPLALYPVGLMNAFKVMPFSAIYFYPSNLLLGKDTTGAIKALAVLWGLTLILGVGYKVFLQKTTKNIVVFGG